MIGQEESLGMCKPVQKAKPIRKPMKNDKIIILNNGVRFSNRRIIWYHKCSGLCLAHTNSFSLILAIIWGKSK